MEETTLDRDPEGINMAASMAILPPVKFEQNPRALPASDAARSDVSKMSFRSRRHCPHLYQSVHMGVRYSGDSVNSAHFNRRHTKGFQVGQTRLPQG